MYEINSSTVTTEGDHVIVILIGSDGSGNVVHPFQMSTDVALALGQQLPQLGQQLPEPKAKQKAKS